MRVGDRHRDVGDRLAAGVAHRDHQMGVLGEPLEARESSRWGPRRGSCRSARWRPAGRRRRSAASDTDRRDGGHDPAAPRSPPAQGGLNIPRAAVPRRRFRLGYCCAGGVGLAPRAARAVTLILGRTKEIDSSSRRSSVPADEERPRRGREHDDPDRQDDRLGDPPAVPVRERVRRPVPVRDEAVLVPAADLDGRVRLRGAGAAGRQLPRAVRRAGPARRLLRARVDPRVRAVRRRDRARRRGRDRDHRRPRRAQDPRGARRAPGARRRSGQEPGRAAVPRADAGHRACSTSTRCCSASSAGSSPRSSTTRRSARSGRRSSTTPRPPTCGARS